MHAKYIVAAVFPISMTSSNKTSLLKKFTSDKPSEYHRGILGNYPS